MDLSLFIMQYAEEAGQIGYEHIIGSIAAYVFFALVLIGIAKKTKTENAWFAWVPILNLVLMLNIAKRPIWWLILLLIPIVNIIFFIIVWVGICKARGKPGWWVILLIIPLVNLVILCMLAWAE